MPTTIYLFANEYLAQKLKGRIIDVIVITKEFIIEFERICEIARFSPQNNFQIWHCLDGVNIIPIPTPANIRVRRVSYYQN